ncbi:hypothetical protein SDC9_202269 [bioreactor metagenome]|uniref:Uncharacterized protein n=1 Tax=bioreactor metagenome TaxID=1076179 RepID=A0A645IT81_9ZZZZ
MGQANLNDIKELTNSRAYKIHSDDKKAELLQRIVDSNFNKTRKKFITEKTKK